MAVYAPVHMQVSDTCSLYLGLAQACVEARVSQLARALGCNLCCGLSLSIVGRPRCLARLGSKTGVSMDHACAAMFFFLVDFLDALDWFLADVQGSGWHVVRLCRATSALIP